MCTHQPRVPDALASDRMAARITITHPEQGWSLLCNGIVVLDGAGALPLGGQEAGPRSLISAFRYKAQAVSASAVQALAALACRSCNQRGGW